MLRGAQPQSALASMRRYAQELSDEVLWKHVELYVNAETEALSDEGRRALEALDEAWSGTRPASTDHGRLEVLDARLFHLAQPTELRTALASASAYEPASLASEGFVHLSYADQLASTLDAPLLPRRRELALVELPARAEGLRVEASRGGDAFPHLYRAVGPGDLLRVWPLRRAADSNTWALPQLAVAATRDGDAGLAPERLGGRRARLRPPGAFPREWAHRAPSAAVASGPRALNEERPPGRTGPGGVCWSRSGPEGPTAASVAAGVAQLEHLLADVLRDRLDLLHGLADAGAGRLVARSRLLDVVAGVLDGRDQVLVVLGHR